MEYITANEATEKWRISGRRVQRYCEDGRIKGVIWFSRVWAIPKNAEKSLDARKKEK